MDEFKFKIGDVVLLKVAAHEKFPTRAIVLERQLQECHGGTQRFYQCRLSRITDKDIQIIGQSMLLTEIELVAEAQNAD